MDIIKICGILAVTAFLTLILKEQNSGMHRLVSVTGTVIAGLFAVQCISPIIEYSNSLGSISSELLSLLIRVLGVSYLTEFAVSVCKDTGETSLATGVELCGKAEILVLSLPLFKQLMELCTGLFS